MQDSNHVSAAIPPLQVPAIIQRRPFAVASLVLKPDGKLDKQPRHPVTLAAAETNDIDTLGTYAEAQDAVATGRAAVSGAVLKRCGVIVIDLDGAIDRGTGEITDGACDILKRFPDALVTISVSGTGLHIWIKAKAPKAMQGAAATFQHLGQKIEILVEKFVAEKWQPFGEPGQIKNYQAALEALYTDLKPAPAVLPPTPSKPLNGQSPTTRESAYVLGALHSARADMEAATDRHRHERRLANAHALAGYLHTGYITESDIVEALSVNFGADQRNAMKTIQDGIATGREKPRAIPEGNTPGIAWNSAKSSENIGSVGFVGNSEQEYPDFSIPPQPLSIPLRPVPQLPVEIIPAPLRAWLKDITYRMSTPLEFAAIPALIGLSALVGRKVGIKPKRHDEWMAIANLWGGIIGTPGVQKTPTTEEALKFLKRLEAEAIEAHQAAMEDHETEEMLSKAKSKAAAGALEKAAKTGKSDDATLRNLARQAKQPEEMPTPTLKRYLVNDTTVEALGERLKENPNGLLVYRDELSAFLKTLDKQGHESDRGFYLESWNGTATNFIYDRIGRGTRIIPAVCASIFGTIQPGPLTRYVRQSVGGEAADGFLPRFQLLVYPDLVEWKHVDQWPDADAKNRAYNIFKRIDTLDPISIGAAPPDEKGIPYFRFSSEAQEFFNAWWTELETTKLRGNSEHPLIEAHLSKYRSLLPSLALLFHIVNVVDGETPGPVSLPATQLAAAWCDLLEEHARRIYQAAFDGDIEPALRLADRIKQSLSNPFTVREVVQKGWAGLSTTEEVEQAVNLLEGHGWIQAIEVPAGPSGGRPSRQLWVNPAVLQGGAAK